jgi:hypothetical protein
MGENVGLPMVAPAGRVSLGLLGCWIASLIKVSTAFERHSGAFGLEKWSKDDFCSAAVARYPIELEAELLFESEKVGESYLAGATVS